MLKVIDGGAESNQAGAAAGVARSPIDEIVREGARRMLAAALQAEVAAYIEQFADELDADGRRLVVRNGYHNEREVMTSSGAVVVRAPRVNDKRVDPETGESKRFSSAILPAWCRAITADRARCCRCCICTGCPPGISGRRWNSSSARAPGLSSASITRLTDPVAGRGESVRPARPVRRGLRLPMGRRDPRQRAPGRGQAVPAGADRGAHRWPQGTGRAHGRLPGGHGVVDGSVARLPPPRHARAGAGDRGRRARILGRAARGVPGDP